MILKCIIIEDEPPAMEVLQRFINQTPFLKLEGSFDNAAEGLALIQKTNIDLIFLDIEMPDISGIELARILYSNINSERPSIIFTTAFDQFAIEGYKLDVIDYLLKPFGYEDFIRAAHKAQNIIQLKISEKKNQVHDDFLYLKVEYQIVKINYLDIVSIEGLKDYAKLHVLNPKRTILSLITLKSLEEKLPADRFMRIHRSTIISLDKITALSKNSVNIGEQQFNVSEQFKGNFGKIFDSWR